MFNYLMRREVLCSIFLQVGLSFFLAHGYDFRVNYLAGKNIVSGLSPYEGGYIGGPLSAGYDSYVQGIGETPIWALFTGLVYLVSFGDIFLFNIILKIPIIMANIALSYLVMKRGGDYLFFLYNPYLLLVSSIWGKPDNVAVLLAIISIAPLDRWYGSLTFASSLMIKPLAISITPSVFAAWWEKRKRIFFTFATTASMFLAPFILLGWKLETVVYGFLNWFKPVGGISPFNFVEAIYGVSTLPQWLEFVSYLSAVAIVVMILLAVKRPPANVIGVFKLGLVSASLFLSLRPWVSEQNLLIILSLFIMVCGRLPTRMLWIAPLVFAGFNLSIPQQLYLLYPPVIEGLAALNHPIRLWLKFATSITWLAVLWTTLIRKDLWRWWV